jgi:quinol monooxygenase YgiN
MAGFVQIIEFTTSRPEEVKAVTDEYRAARVASGDQLPVVRSTVTADKDRPNTYLNIVEFASYEDAMANSKNPATSAMSAKMMALCDGPPKFLNLDIVETLEFAKT